MLRGLGDTDIIFGGGGNDVLVGGGGADVLNGDAGADRFDYNNPLHAAPSAIPELIVGFSRGERDRIDLRDIDAVDGQAGNQAFRFIGSAAFTAEGQLRAVSSGSNIVVEANIDGADGAEMQLVLQQPTVGSLQAGDFFL